MNDALFLRLKSLFTEAVIDYRSPKGRHFLQVSVPPWGAQAQCLAQVGTLTSVELGKPVGVFSRLVPQHRLKGTRTSVLRCRFTGEPADLTKNS